MKKEYIGIDAHKESNALACAYSGRDKPQYLGKASAELSCTT